MKDLHFLISFSSWVSKNVSDYLKWRGDLDFSQAPFNDVDNLILAQIAYVDFTDIVPAPGSIETITIAEAADTFFDTHDEKEIKKCKSFIGKAPYLLREAAAKSGVLAGIVLGIGRAIGETMAVIMIVGNQPRIAQNILQRKQRHDNFINS